MEKISLRQAVKQGIELVRRDPWEPSSRLKLPLLMFQMDMDEPVWERWTEEEPA